MANCAIVGINWGDEGKGRMVDYLTERYDVVVRYQGGGNAGHTVINDMGKFALHLLPSGIFRKGVMNILGNGVALDCENLVQEMETLRAAGVSVSPENLMVSSRASLLLPWHRELDALEEARLKDKKYGSTKQGIAPFYSDKYQKKTVQAGELLYPDHLKAHLQDLLEWKNLILQKVYGAKGYTMEELEQWLDTYSSGRSEVTDEELSRNNARIRTALENYRIQINDVKAIVGPTVTLYKVYPAPGVKISEIKKLQEDLGMHLHARGVRVVTLTDSVGIEVANDRPSIVPMRAVLNDEAFRVSKAELPVAIGYTIQQKVKVFDLADAPHLLVAGATKQGKSVGLNVIVTSLLYSKHPSELKLVFIDPKMVEFSAYSHLLKHYLAVLPCNDETEEMDNAIVKKADKADKILRSLCIEMDQRYELLSKASVPNIKTYNEKYRNRRLRPDEGHRFLPYMVTIIDEYADLTMSVGGSGDAKAVARSITTSIIRLAQKGRAAGLHVVLATQRPSVDVITGLIKTNFPTRIAFRVVSRTDSSTILDSSGAEKLIGKGDMLYYAGVEMERVQCAYIDSEEINRLTEYIGSQSGYKKSFNTPFYLPPVDDDTEEGSGGMVDMTKLDERFDEAAKLVVMSQRGSTSDLQRRLGMGYAKAGRVMDQLQAAGIVGPQEGSKPRQVLVSSLDELDQIIAAYKSNR